MMIGNQTSEDCWSHPPQNHLENSIQGSNKDLQFPNTKKKKKKKNFLRANKKLKVEIRSIELKSSTDLKS